jgi:hypothetical protein
MAMHELGLAMKWPMFINFFRLSKYAQMIPQQQRIITYTMIVQCL